MLRWNVKSRSSLKNIQKEIKTLLPEKHIHLRNRLRFIEEYLQWLITNRKTTTIRYVPDGIDLPEDIYLPIGITVDGVFTKQLFIPWGLARVKGIEIKKFVDLNNYDALRDGFKSTEELKNALCFLYNKRIEDEEYVTIYSLLPVFSYKKRNIISVGLNVGYTSYGKRLRDGSTTIIEGGKILTSIAEERVTRRKAEGGFKYSLPAAMDSERVYGSEVSVIVTSSCVDFPSAEYEFPAKKALRSIRISHHLSHAYSAFLLSPFDESLIIVMDAGGDILEHHNNERGNEWWKYKREQISCYIGRGKHVELLCRLFDKPFDTGFGEMYRAFTYYLGWHSYTKSANTMALAAYGNRDRFAGVELFPFDEDLGFFSVIENNPRFPINMLRKFSNTFGLHFPPPRQIREGSMEDEIPEIYKDMAAYIQSELEKGVIKLISWLVRKTGIKKMCLAGGVALNCVANTRILEETEVTDLFVVPAAGDTGQSMGNALFGYIFMGGSREELEKFQPYLGLRHPAVTYESMEAMLSKQGVLKDVRIKMLPQRDYVSYLAFKLSEGSIVGWFHGRSEFGPRALGHRSILATPFHAYTKVVERKLREVKRRQWFRPFSPSILEEKTHSYFDLPAKTSPYMLLVGRAKGSTARVAPLIVHVDGTSRLQTVSSEDTPVFYDLIDNFYRITGLPFLVNTSFNTAGMPMVETVDEAVEVFINTPIDILAADGIIVEKH